MSTILRTLLMTWQYECELSPLHFSELSFIFIFILLVYVPVKFYFKVVFKKNKVRADQPTLAPNKSYPIWKFAELHSSKVGLCLVLCGTVVSIKSFSTLVLGWNFKSFSTYVMRNINWINSYNIMIRPYSLIDIICFHLWR